MSIEPKLWVFIAGCPNSGTTLLHNLLARDHRIASLPKEGQFCTGRFVLPKDIGLSRLWGMNPEAFRVDVGDAALAKKVRKDWAFQWNRKRADIFLEKSPTDTLRLPWLAQNFKPARFLTIVRNPYAVVEGIRRNAGHSVEQCALHWLRANDLLDRNRSTVEPCLHLSYESLSSCTAHQLSSVYAFLGLEDLPDVDDEMRVHERSRKIRDMNQEAISRLSPGEITIINDVIGQANITNRGYEYLG